MAGEQTSREQYRARVELAIAELQKTIFENRSLAEQAYGWLYGPVNRDNKDVVAPERTGWFEQLIDALETARTVVRGANELLLSITNDVTPSPVTPEARPSSSGTTNPSVATRR